MNQNRIHGTGNQQGEIQTTNTKEEVEIAVNQITEVLENTLTDEFNITSDITKNNTEFVGFVKVTHPAGNLNFSVGGDLEPKEYNQLGTDISAEIVRQLLSENLRENAPAM